MPEGRKQPWRGGQIEVSVGSQKSIRITQKDVFESDSNHPEENVFIAIDDLGQIIVWMQEVKAEILGAESKEGAANA